MNSKVYKWCAVPQCTNTSIKTPNKVFVHVPNKKIIRIEWLKLARRNPDEVVMNSPLYFCEDHFDLPNDMVNYMQYHVMGSVSQVRMIPGCMPHKFLCQSQTSDSTERPCIAKRRKLMISEECFKEFEEKLITEQLIVQLMSEEIASSSSDKGIRVTAEPSKAELELDKFKRRLIRAVARLLLAEKKPEEEVWSTLKKETGCDCQILWMRMRALTLKKLHRLFAANDVIKDIPKVARMSFTDWLLFDMVLVHQKVDVIGQDKMSENTKHDPKPLVDLFELVKEFKIEGRRCASLAVAWSAATLKYNSKGHQCSPMLLQLRWYQLKEATRDKFYNFWYAYRGTAKRLSLAEPHTPSPLQAAIATHFKYVVTKPFLEWEELIRIRMVTLPEEFERRMMDRSFQIMRHPVPTTSADLPDVVVIEPHIETIDLGAESDDEDQANEIAEKTESFPETPVKIKEEPVEMDIDIEETRVEEPPKKSLYEVVLESTTIEQEKIDSIDDVVGGSLEITDDESAVQEDAIKEIIESTITAPEPVLPQITSVFGNVSDTSVLPENALKNTEDTAVLSNIDNALVVGNVEEAPVLAKDDDTVIIDSVVNPVALENIDNTKKLVTSGNTSVVNEDANVTDVRVDESYTILCRAANTLSPRHDKVIDTEQGDNIIPRTENTISPRPNGTEKDPNIKSRTENAMIPREDVIIDTDQDDNINKNTFEPPVSANDAKEKEYELVMEDPGLTGNATQDEAMDVDVKPIVDTFIEPFKASNTNEDVVKAEDIIDNKLNDDVKSDITRFSFSDLSNDINFVDDGIELVDDGIAYHDEDNDDEINNGGIPNIDQKLLMCPIIYTTKLDDMKLLHATPFAHIKGNTLLDSIILQSKPSINKSVKEESSETDSSEDEISDNQRVKLSSYLLQKPRSRTYNPIQLCKNPDFNTRLKRLTVGFFSSHRNRGLIKSCKPLTIDLSKAFETKLFSGTMYLKPSDQNIKQEIITDTESGQSTIVPSAMPAQSLINNSKIADIVHVSAKPPDESGSSCERNKVINLPDISEIRRINQRLLTAEVTPIQVHNRPLAPVSIITTTTSPNVEVEGTTFRGPPNVVDMTAEDSPTNKNTARKSFTDITLNTFQTNKPGRRPFQYNWSYTGHSSRGRKKFPPTVLWKPRPRTAEIPWLSKNQEAPASKTTGKIEETLLTLDTLNKMLYLLSHENEDPKPKPKPKKKKKRPEPQKESYEEQILQHKKLADMEVPVPVEGSPQLAELLTRPSKPLTFVNKTQADKQACVNKTQENKTLAETETTEKCTKPKINIKSAANVRHTKRNQPLVKSCNVTDGLTESDTEPSEKSNICWPQSGVVNKEIKYCCWARERMLQMLFSRKRIPPHPCPYPLCKCCCRNLLEQYIINDRELKKAKQQNESTIIDVEESETVAITKVLDTLNSDDVVVDVEATVEIPDEDPQENTVQVEETNCPVRSISQGPVLVVGPIGQDEIRPDKTRQDETRPDDTQQDETRPDDTRQDETRQDSAITVDDNEPVNIDTVEPQECVPVLGGEVSVTTTSVVPLVLSGQPCRTQDVPIDVRINIFGPKATNPPRKQNVVAVPQPYFTPQVLPAATPLSNRMYPIKTAAPNTLGSNTLPLENLKQKPYTPPKNCRERMIFLNSKQISDNPNDNPIYLGKNKILLTTIKFPPNLKKFEEAKRALKSSIQIPHGVQLICLPNGSITYTIDHNVQVNATELASMPAIIAKVQAEINKPDPVVGLLRVDVADNEVVDLIDDDDDAALKQNKNVESSSKPGVPTILIDGTESTTNSLHDNSHNETVVNSDNSNKENITDCASEIRENNPNTDADHNAPPIQENVQELSHSETPKTSAGSDQTAATSTEVSITSEPITVKKSKNILSDLMEMSGIFEEDITPSPEETLTMNAIEQQVINASQSVEAQEVETVNAAKSTTSVPQIHVLPINNLQNNKAPVIKSPIGELSPITSLYELKYACVNNGTFFKLDFETGFLVPINVCMKQQPKPVPKSIDPKSVIDLTEEENDKEEPAATFSVSNKSTDKRSLLIKSPDKRSLLIVNNSKNKNTTATNACTSSNEVKPIKLFKVAKPPILVKRPSHGTSTTLDNVTCKNPKIDHKSKRKQFIRKDDSTNDSNTVMVKLPASKMCYRKPKRKLNAITSVIDTGEDNGTKSERSSEKQKDQKNLESDNSSDEEPLSNLAKRKRENEKNLHKQKEADAYQNIIQSDIQKVVQLDIQNEVRSDSQSGVQSIRRSEVGIELQPDDSEDVYMRDQRQSESEADYEILLDRSMVEDAEEEEQCILGV